MQEFHSIKDTLKAIDNFKNKQKSVWSKYTCKSALTVLVGDDKKSEVENLRSALDAWW